jgi:hypothetical protein
MHLLLRRNKANDDSKTGGSNIGANLTDIDYICQ